MRLFFLLYLYLYIHALLFFFYFWKTPLIYIPWSSFILWYLNLSYRVLFLDVFASNIFANVFSHEQNWCYTISMYRVHEFIFVAHSVYLNYYILFPIWGGFTLRVVKHHNTAISCPHFMPTHCGYYHHMPVSLVHRTQILMFTSK